MVAPKQPDDALEHAVALLSRRGLSEQELHHALGQRHSVEETHHAIERCKQLGYLDDHALAGNLCERARAQGKGPLWIAQKLASRGISELIVRELVAEPDAALRERAMSVATQRFGDLTHKSLRERARVCRFLEQRGFPSGLASIIAQVEE